MRDVEYRDDMIITTDYNHDGIVTVKTTQDVEPYLDSNKREFNDTPEFGKFSKGNWHKVASLPMVVVQQFMREGLNPFSGDPEVTKKILQRLNDPDFKLLKTMNVKL